MTDINKLAERLRELSQAAADARWSEFSVLCGNADHVLQTAADILKRALGDLPEGAIDGGWTARGIIEHYRQERETAARELVRLNSALAEHMHLTRDAVAQCDTLRAQLREIESAPVSVPEPASDYEAFLRKFRAAMNDEDGSQC